MGVCRQLVCSQEYKRCRKGIDGGLTTINSLSRLSKRRCSFCPCSWSRVASGLPFCFHFADETQFERSKIFRKTIKRCFDFQLKVELVRISKGLEQMIGERATP